MSKAAEDSHISLSAGSRRISLLEHHYKVTLLDRLPRGVEPTLAGEVLMKHAQELLRTASLMDSEMSDYSKGGVGRVRIFANTSAMSQYLPDQIALLASSQPNIKLEIREMRSRYIAQAVLDGTADVGVVTATIPSEAVRFEPYCIDRLCVVVPGAHRLKAKRVSFESLLDFDFVGLDDTAAITQLLTDAAAAVERSLKLRIQVQGFESVCRLIAAGQGIGILPEGAVQAFKKTMSLRFIKLSNDWAERQMYLCIRTGQIPASTRRVFEHFRNLASVKAGK